MRRQLRFGCWGSDKGNVFGVTVLDGFELVAHLAAGRRYGHHHLLVACGDCLLTMRQAICGLAVLAISDGRLMA